MRVDAELFDICKEFIKDNKISSDEDIYDSDIEAQTLQLLEQICDLIGYYDYEEEEEYEE
jgi:hypothetical protein